MKLAKKSMQDDIIYPDNLEKGRYEYNILLMLKLNPYGCQWSNLLDKKINISESTLSKYTRKLIRADFIKKISKTVKIKSNELKKKFYLITNKGLKRIEELETLKRDIQYPQQNLPFNSEEKLLWMLNNNQFCQWRHFLDERLNISQSSLSKVLNRLIHKGLTKRLIIEEKRFPIYRITLVGKRKYLEILESKNLGRKTILNEKIKQLKEIYFTSKIFFEEHNINEEDIIFQFNKYKSILEYQSLFRNELVYNLIILFLSINHPDNYPQYISKKDFSLKYSIALETLEYFLNLIIKKEIYPINFFVLKLSKKQIYYVFEGDKKEIFLKVIIEDFLEKKFHHDLIESKKTSLKNTFTISIDEISEIVSIIINEYKLFDERFKTSLIEFMKNYLKHLIIKYEKVNVIRGFESLISSFSINILADSQNLYLEKLNKNQVMGSIQVKSNERIKELQENLKKIKIEIKTRPEDHKLLLEKGTLLRKLDLYEEAINLYLSLLNSRDPVIKSYKIFMDLALSYLGKYELENAIITLTDGIKLYPENSDLYGFKADILLMKNDYSAALDNINMAIQFKNDDSLLYEIKAKILYRMKKFDLALETIKESIEIDHSYPGIYRLKSQILMIKGIYKEALISIEKEISNDQTNALNYSLKAQILKGLKDSEKALKAVSHAIILNPDNINLYLEKAFILVDMNNSEDALTTLEKARKTKSKKTLFSQVGQALLLILLGKNKESLKIIDEFIEQSPDFSIGYEAKALILMYMNSLELALDSIEKALTLKPRFSLQYRIKICILINSGKLREALNTVEEALILSPNDIKLEKAREFILNKKGKG